MIEIQLKKPIQVLATGQMITSVTVNEPTGKQVKDAHKAGGEFKTVGQEDDYKHHLMASCTGLTVQTIEQAAETDLIKIWKTIDSFFLEVRTEVEKI